MPYKFKSRATADLIMLDATARGLLEIVGKDANGSGIITAEQIPGALAALEQAVGSDEARHAEPLDGEIGQDEDGDAPAQGEGVSLRQRTAPFIDMLKRSAAEGRDVTW